MTSANRASLRRFSLVSRMSRSMSCVVTGAPFSMLAELPMTMASSRARRRALASATSVFAEISEDVAAIVPPSDEHCAAQRREQEAAHDHPQIAGIHLWKLGRQSRRHLLHLARESLHVAGAPSERAVA